MAKLAVLATTAVSLEKPDARVGESLSVILTIAVAMVPTLMAIAVLLSDARHPLAVRGP